MSDTKYNIRDGNSQSEKVALYCRVSTEEQSRTGEGIADQLQALRQWAKDNGCVICGEYLDEGYSARKSYKTRPALQQLLKDVEDNQVSLIAFTRLDRWFRNISDYYRTQDILDKHNCRWQAITEDYETVTSSGKFKVGIMLAVAEHEANQVSDRMKFTFAEKRKRGEFIGGRPPLGYKREGKKLVKDPDTEEAMNRLFEVYLKTKSQKAAIEAAAAMGYVVNQQYISRMLHKCSITHAGTISGAPAEPYITPEQAAEIEASVRTFKRTKTTEFMFSGLLKCGVCGRIMAGHNNFTSNYKHNRTRTYNCQNRYHFHPPLCTNSANIREAQVEEYLLGAIEQAVDDNIAAAIRLQQSTPKRTSDRTRKRTQARMDRLLDAFLDGTIPKDTYLQKLHQLEAELAAIKKEREPVVIPQRIPPDWRTVYSTLDIVHRRAFWAGLISSVTVYPDKHMEINFTPL